MLVFKYKVSLKLKFSYLGIYYKHQSSCYTNERNRLQIGSHYVSKQITHHIPQISFHNQSWGQRNPLDQESPRFEIEQMMNWKFHL